LPGGSCWDRSAFWPASLSAASAPPITIPAIWSAVFLNLACEPPAEAISMPQKQTLMAGFIVLQGKSAGRKS
jgi:hypothetical protein